MNMIIEEGESPIKMDRNGILSESPSGKRSPLAKSIGRRRQNN